jgi:DNA-binding transcriptional MerR regulator
MKLTLGQAARQAGLTKATLSRYVKQGKISAEKQADGSYRIDPSELDRLPDIRTASNSHGTPTVQHSEIPHDTGVLHREVELLRTLLQDRERQIEELRRDRDRQIEDLRQERDAWRQQAQTLLLTAGSQEQKSKRWWRWRKT